MSDENLTLDDDCVIQEENITTITLEDSIATVNVLSSDDESDGEQPSTIIDCEQESEVINISESNVTTVEVNDSENVAEETTQTSKDTCLFRLEFRDCDTFEQLSSLVCTPIRDILFALQKSVAVSVDKDTNSVQFLETEAANDVFMIDTLPTEKQVNSEIPNYEKIAEALLKIPDAASETPTEDSGRFKQGCWNCSGDHNMRDCKEPRNAKNIKRARDQFQARYKTERYHVDVEQKYSNFKPGGISDGLREALGLRKRELPLYIYKMRLYGYPPGWLEEAKVSHSGLTLFTSMSSAVPDGETEDGEVDKVTFDSTQFIDFPGFNAALPDGFIDDSHYYGVPPMQQRFTREGLMQALEGNLAKTYKRKKLKLSVEATTPEIELGAADMDIADDSNDESPVLFPMPRPTPETETSNGDRPVSQDENSVTLNDLELQKRELLVALADANTEQNSIESPTESNSNSNGISTSAEVNSVEISSEQVKSRSVTPTDDQSTLGQSKETLAGTPLLKCVSPYQTLPKGNKWSVGVSDVIDFENLPDATGTYKKLSGILGKVRNVVKEINDRNEDDDL